MKKPLVSICCTTFNHEKFIEDAMNGFLMQKTNFEYEILIHDDASTDGTQKIIKIFEDKYPSLFNSILQSENQYSKGVKPFITHLFPRAQGKYIAMCEGDDFWTDPLKLQKQVDILENDNDVVFVAHNANLIDVSKNLLKKFNESNVPKYTSLHELLTKSWYIPTASLIFRRDKLNFPIDIKRVTNGDFLLQLMLASDGGKIYYINEIMSSYRIHDTGISKQFSVGCNFETAMIALYKIFNRETQGLHKELVFENISKHAYSKMQKSKKWSSDFNSSLVTYVRYKKNITKAEVNYIIGHIFMPNRLVYGLKLFKKYFS